MSAQKKGIYWYKIGNCILAYYKGEVLLTPATPTMAGSGLPWNLSPTITQAFQSMCGLFSMAFGMIDRSIVSSRKLADFGRLLVRPSEICGHRGLAFSNIDDA
jgi:hypothetical protein